MRAPRTVKNKFPLFISHLVYGIVNWLKKNTNKKPQQQERYIWTQSRQSKFPLAALNSVSAFSGTSAQPGMELSALLASSTRGISFNYSFWKIHWVPIALAPCKAVGTQWGAKFRHFVLLCSESMKAAGINWIFTHGWTTIKEKHGIFKGWKGKASVPCLSWGQFCHLRGTLESVLFVPTNDRGTQWKRTVC